MRLGGRNFLLLVVILMTSSVSLMAESSRAAAASPTGPPEEEVGGPEAAETLEEDGEEAGGGTGEVEPLSVKYVEKITGSKRSDDHIKTMCSRCSNHEVCVQAVLEVNKERDPKKLNVINVVDLQLASILEVIELASMDCVALGKAKGNELCAGLYMKALEELSNAMRTCEEANDPQTAMKKVSPLIAGGLKHVKSCENELKTDNSSPLIQVNAFVTKLGDNCVALANDISTGATDLRK